MKKEVEKEGRKQERKGLANQKINKKASGYCKKKLRSSEMGKVLQKKKPGEVVNKFNIK